MKRYFIALVFILCFSAVYYGCKKEVAGISVITVKLTDAPAAFDHVYVEVTGVEIHSNHTGWILVPVQDSIYDLLSIQNNANAVLGTLQLPSGKISQVRLILGVNNSVVVSGVSYPLALSSQDESGLKLNIHQDLSAGINYVLMIDFDALQSIHQNGHDAYKLKPVLTATFQ